MPAAKRRVNIVLERPTYEALQEVARSDRVSVSTKAHDLLRDALEFVEDLGLLELANERAQSFDPKTALTYEQVFPRRSRRGQR